MLPFSEAGAAAILTGVQYCPDGQSELAWQSWMSSGSHARAVAHSAPVTVATVMTSLPSVQFAPALSVAFAGLMQQTDPHCLGELHSQRMSPALHPVSVHDCVAPKHTFGGIGSPHGNAVVWNLHEGGVVGPASVGVVEPSDEPASVPGPGPG